MAPEETWSPGFIMTFRETGRLSSVCCNLTWCNWRQDFSLGVLKSSHNDASNEPQPTSLHVYISLFFSSSVLLYSFFVDSNSIDVLMSTKEEPLAEEFTPSKKKKKSLLPICLATTDFRRVFFFTNVKMIQWKGFLLNHLFDLLTPKHWWLMMTVHTQAWA